MQKPPKTTFSVKLPTKPYLRKYFYARYGSPLKLNYTNTLGILVLCLLEKKEFTIKMNDDKKDSRLSHMIDEIEFVAPLSSMDYRGYHLEYDKIIAINRYLEEAFVEDLHKYCKDHTMQRSWRPGIDQAIHSFADMYTINLDSDITFDALKKAEWRHRKRKEKKVENSSVTFVPSHQTPSQLGFSSMYFSLSA